MKLTNIEIGTLAAAMEDDGVMLCTRLNIPSPDEVDRSAGLSALFARELVVEGDDGLEVESETAAAISVAAAADRVIRITTSSEDSFGSAQLHWTDEAAVSITPLGFGTFEFSFVDAEAGLDAVISAVAAAVDIEGAFIVTDIDSDRSAAIRSHDGVRSVLNAGSNEFVPTDSDLNWSSVLDELVEA